MLTCLVTTICHHQHILRDWSLITGRVGELQNRKGGMGSVTPTKRRGGGGTKSFSHAEGGAQQVLG